LYEVEMTNIDSTTNNTISLRQRDIINVRGFKICMEVTNKGAVPLYFNVAVIAPKDGAAGVNTVDFFRSSATERARDFSTDLTSLEYHCLPINTDRYTVLKHKRYRLLSGPTGSDYIANSGKNYMNLDWYIPLKRQVRFNNGDGGSPESGKVYFVYWGSGFGQNGGVIQGNADMEITERIVTYFREPRA